MWGKQQNTLRLERTADPRDCRGQMILDQRMRFRSAGIRLEWTLKDVRQHQTALLKLDENHLFGLPFHGNLDGFENGVSFTVLRKCRTVKKFIIAL